ncbi:flagellar hook-basal body complex protein FliE [Alterisphingorhabdus coralli]|uniref:Flagellar hook-basal body complex protein FliE n=1 Tax=Alterisphingorhabdus coralli TaxID=3071408 RepID=A0AA97I1H9_9SPHN|nr:flagellar hook-basal body complex protein FliE [Parasphingorhabdus sp. SCSIO 66989]WOE74765.1 flagellar hook-basal body complex protein FliE [Parasphingorhabdus sp. SCSIO 66989]
MSTINSLMSARNAIIQSNKALQGIAEGAEAKGNKESEKADFTGAMREAVESVNALQQQASAAATAYEMGETTDIASVMLAKQKASVGFEATMQVRNKLLSAYQDIMNMPV